MMVQIDLSAEEQAAFRARAEAEGLTLEAWIKKTASDRVESQSPPMQFDDLADLLLSSPFAGSELDLERARDYPRAIPVE